MEDLERNYSDAKKIFDNRTFKYELLISFWLAVHLEKLPYAQFICSLDTIIEKMLQTLRKNQSNMKLQVDKKSKSNRTNQEKNGISSIEELKEIKALMKSQAGTTFNTNVMRIALNMQEERIASLIVS